MVQTVQIVTAGIENPNNSVIDQLRTLLKYFSWLVLKQLLDTMFQYIAVLVMLQFPKNQF
jgi:hypothetical protein